MKTTKILIGIMGAVLVFGSCKARPTIPVNPLVQTVAVLLFNSESNNVDAPEIMQLMVYSALSQSVYQVPDIAETNARLNEMGIVDGGQLPALDPVKIGKDLGVQALLYGNVETFGTTNLGVYVSKKVVLELQLIDASTGQEIWSNVGQYATRKFATTKEEISENFALGLVEQLVESIFNTPLAAEGKLATRAALSTLPGFRFNGFGDMKGKDGSPFKFKSKSNFK